MNLKDFMNRAVETIRAQENAEAAYQKMKLNKIRHLIVVEGKEVVGILSERDIKGMNSRERQGNQIENLMQRHVVTATPETTIREAANLMRGHTIGCLPILEKNKLVGIVTITDLLDLLGQGKERPLPNTARRPVTRENPSKTQAKTRRQFMPMSRKK